MTAACAIDWPAFGLDPEPGCDLPAAFMVAQACVHEHVARSRACYGCVAELVRDCPPDEWWCEPCRVAGHVCPAPLHLEELPPPFTGRVIYACPGCEGDLEADGLELWCPDCQTAVSLADMHDDRESDPWF